METLIRILRTAGLAAAVLVLPCCRDQVGQGDEVGQVTVRASLNLAKLEPELGVFEPSISANGQWLVFASFSNNITPNDTSNRRDLFLKNRLTGEIVNLTDIFVDPFSPAKAPDDCFEPVISDDGNFIAFSSKGGWAPYVAPAPPFTNRVIFRMNRTTGQFRRAFESSSFDPDNPMTQPTISADGRFVAFATKATDLIPPNPDEPSPGIAGFAQIYVYDFDTDAFTIVSRGIPGPVNTPCNSHCSSPQVSADGSVIVFESSASNLHADTAGLPMPQVYRGNSLGDPVTPLAYDPGGNITDDLSFLPAVSGNGRFVVFHSIDAQLVTPAVTSFDFLLRKDLLTGETALVTDEPAFLPIPIFPAGYVPSISTDGRSVAFMSRHNSLAGGIDLKGFAQVFVRDFQTGTLFYCSRHKDGTPSNLDCDAPRISGDGKWVVWATKGSTLVDGDTNAVSDVFLRGPLR